jgi:serine/threonine protein kinase/tetratricopeptide (TPR) repeat protein
MHDLDLGSTAAHLATVAAALADRYTVLRELGRGGMAVVYLADDHRHARKVALKVLNPEFTASVGAERFQREIKIAAGLTHPLILGLHDSGEKDGILYYVMPYIEGESLRQRIDRLHDLPVEAAVTIARQVADALGYAHAHGFVHRDVKPENILLMGDHALVADFGIARAVGVSATGAITQSGIVVGSPLYMSPEQSAADGELDGRSDLYSLGCVLFEMLVGTPPYTGSTPMRLMARHAVDPIPSAHVMRSEISAALDGVITRALAKNPDDRFPSALAFLTALQGAMTPGSGAPVGLDSSEFVTPSLGTHSPAAPARVAPVVRASSPTAVNSVAVLPFADLSQAKDQEFFCDGITEDLRGALARLPGLRVASRTSALSYKGRSVDVRTIGRELDVAAVLEGTVQRGGDRLRLTASLIGTSDGLQLWSEVFERDATDIFSVQNEIARSVVDSLSVTLSSSQPALVPRTTTNVEAYQLYLRGRHFWNRRQEGGLQKAVQCFRDALELDPLYVLPYVGLADAFNTFGAYEYLPPKDAFPRVIAAAERALSIDPTLAEAHTALGSARGHYFWEWRLAEESFQRALALNPQYALAHAYYSLALAATGRHERARDAIARAQQLDPLSQIVNALVGWVAFYARRLDDAIHQYKIAIEMEPNFPVVHSFLGFALLAAGRPDEALAEFQSIPNFRTALGGLGNSLAAVGRHDEARAVLVEMEKYAEGAYVSAFSRAMIHIGLGDREEALRWLEIGLEERPYTMSFLAVAAIVDPLRNEPRFARIIERMGVADVTGAIVRTA